MSSRLTKITASSGASSSVSAAGIDGMGGRWLCSPLRFRFRRKPDAPQQVIKSRVTT